VKQFKDWGINFLRVLLTHDDDYWQVVNDGEVDITKRCIVREENLRHMDQRVKWLENNEIYFLMEIHWRALGLDDKLVEPELLAKQFSQVYRMLAERYKPFNYLMGFCMFSEIYVAPQYRDSYRKIRTAIIDAVHEVDPSRMVSTTGIQTSSPESLIDAAYIDRPGVIYDIHFYSPKMFTHYRTYYGDLRYPGFVADGWAPGVELVDMDYLKSKLKPAFDFSKKYNVPIWCGEFGAFNNAPDGSSPRWERDVVWLFEKNNIPWIFWKWREKEKTVPEYWKEFWHGTIETSYVTIAPHGGPFAGSVNVKIDSTVDAAQIRYTIDGTNPTSGSKLYHGSFTIGKSATVKAAAFDGDEAVAKVDSASFYQLKALSPDTPKEQVPGLKYKYYEVNPEQVENLQQLKPVKTGIAEYFERELAERDNNIALEFTGLIEIPCTGLYYFYTSDAGASKLWIGETLVVENIESRWVSVKSGYVPLSAGMHPIKALYYRADKEEVFYAQDKKDRWFKIEYEGPDIEKQEIPKKVLWHAPERN
jgi:hypothetical protein